LAEGHPRTSRAPASSPVADMPPSSTPRKRTRRVPAQPVEVLSEYEQARQERIKRNHAMLKSLHVREAAANLQDAAMHSLPSTSASRPALRQSIRKRRPVAPKAAVARKRSSRIQERGGSKPNSAELLALSDSEDGGPKHIPLEQYFKERGIKVGPKVDGRFKGWVDPDVCERYGIAGSADEAWERHGGGKFTFKIDRSALPKEVRGKGYSDAKAFSITQLHKNPNAYFYRNVAPHETQAFGEWTEEEHSLFLNLARKYGCGDKWGLFASHFRHRVGYQCSAYYRDEIIANGLIIDDRFMMTSGGRPVFVG